MLNQIVLVGRIVNKPELNETENERKISKITLAVPRSFKNAEGEYETDFIDCVMWQGIASSTALYCKKGDLIGLKGRVESSTYEKEGQKHKSIVVVAEKVTFLSSKASNDDIHTADEEITVEKQKVKK